MSSGRRDEALRIVGDLGRAMADGWTEDVIDEGRYLLVEAGRNGLWAATYPDPNTAAVAHVGQEYAEDWQSDVPTLIDVETGQEWRGEMSLRWMPFPPRDGGES